MLTSFLSCMYACIQAHQGLCILIHTHGDKLEDFLDFHLNIILIKEQPPSPVGQFGCQVFRTYCQAGDFPRSQLESRPAFSYANKERTFCYVWMENGPGFYSIQPEE